MFKNLSATPSWTKGDCYQIYRLTHFFLSNRQRQFPNLRHVFFKKKMSLGARSFRVVKYTAKNREFILTFTMSI